MATVLRATMSNGAYSQEIEDEDRRCSHCHSQSLRVDWAQGDRVCTNCGVVDEEHIRDERPEWRDYNDIEDVIKGRAAPARCGLVAVDEQKYLGGLQPTSLSKYAFGSSTVGAVRAAEEKVRKKLMTTNRKLDHMMEKMNSNCLKRARLSLQARKRWKQRGLEEFDETEDMRPEHDEIVLQEEEEAERAHAVLLADKWSLDRAVLLHGSDDEQVSKMSDLAAEREELMSRLDNKLKRAAADLYKAYSILKQSARRLDLPDRVSVDASNTLCGYASKRDGFLVRGVSTRLAPSDKHSNQNDALEKLREYNKLKQMAALSSALLYLTGRKHGCARSLQEVCSTFENPTKPDEKFIKPKHTSKAINELRNEFPDFYRSAGTYVTVNTDNYVEHATRKLDLPPVATSCVRTLVKYCQEQKNELEIEGQKVSTTCASVAYFICMVGDIMQRLARQSKGYKSALKPSSEPGEKKASKHLKMEQKDNIKQKKRKFDVFSHDAIQISQAEKKEYEMRRIWDAWSEQMTWTRPIVHIEQSCGVSRNVIMECFKTTLFPNRELLLDVLSESVKTDGRLKETPLAQALLSNVATAAPLMGNKNPKHV